MSAPGTDRSPASSPLVRWYSLGFSLLTFALLLSFILMPDFSLSSISTNIRWRPQMINLYNSFRLRVGDRVFNDVVVGEKGWLFLMDSFSAQSFQNYNMYTRKELASVRSKLDGLSQDLESKGITLLVVIPPEKASIYPRYVPQQLEQFAQTSDLDQFIEYMRETGKTRVIDLRPALKEISREQLLYYRTDTHWNHIGGYYAYARIMKPLARLNPRLAPHPLSDFQRLPQKGHDLGDLTRMLGVTQPLEQHWRLKPEYGGHLEVRVRQFPDDTGIRFVTNGDPGLPRLLIFHDSFYYSISGPLESHFSQTTAVQVTATPGVWTLDWIDKEDPDVVIIEIVQRHLRVHLPLLLATWGGPDQ